MLETEVDAAAAGTAADLRATYERLLGEVVEEVGADTVAAETGLASETVDRIAAGEAGDLTLSDAAAVLALSPSRPDAQTIVQEARDALLLGMSVAVVDVDAVASNLDGDLDAKEIQAKIEGRQPMTLAEYARIQHFVEASK